MKYTILTMASLVLAAGTAVADPMNQPTDWSGNYIGIGLSYSDGSYDAENNFTPPDATGVLGSAIVGRNYQQDHLVYGGELVLNFGNIEERSTGGCGVGAAGCRSTIEQYAAIRGRVGYTFNQTLVFMTLGIATDRQDQRAFGINAAGDSQRHYGYTVGIGVEQDIADDWSIRGDLEYYDFNSRTYSFLGGTSIDPDTTAVRFSLVKRF
ncbi:Outer membrane protein beta-barrel domain-containing protein [Sulfitobacter litoralis]|uniref:Outer membrane protein beta-barrel domain-containing protein n=1 Tax=Sulfitobacter litoralis TaxID=335975 RepID=A0ABY0SUD6_9RHOB|nr:outer membrane beta-barrel protein [Sulfitobacter litoralis]SDP62030.1 Outer membrane protein beta-barrel domain-containing protein [Sulfitobacter litoralis]